MTNQLKSEWFKEMADQILDKFTINPDARLRCGITASERIRTYIIAAIDNIERDLESVE